MSNYKFFELTSYNLGLINSFFLSNEVLVSMLQSTYVLNLIKIKLVT